MRASRERFGLRKRASNDEHQRNDEAADHERNAPPPHVHLPVVKQAVKEDALRELRDWAAGIFGSLDAAASEQHEFELEFFTFDEKEED